MYVGMSYNVTLRHTWAPTGFDIDLQSNLRSLFTLQCAYSKTSSPESPMRQDRLDQEGLRSHLREWGAQLPG